MVTQESIPLPWGYWRYRVLAFVCLIFFLTSLSLSLDPTQPMRLNLLVWFLGWSLFIFLDLSVQQMKRGNIPWVAKKLHWATDPPKLSQNLHRFLLGVLIIEVIIGIIFFIQLPPDIVMWQYS